MICYKIKNKNSFNFRKDMIFNNEINLRIYMIALPERKLQASKFLKSFDYLNKTIFLPITQKDTLIRSNLIDNGIITNDYPITWMGKVAAGLR